MKNHGARFYWAIVCSFLGLVSATSQAGYQGSVEFTPDEITAHTNDIRVITTEATACLQEFLNSHLRFYNRYGFSRYYGDNSSFGKLPYAEKREFLRTLGKDPALLSQMSPTSCIGLTLRCLGRGFKAAQQDTAWKKVFDFTKLNGVSGEALQFALRKLGWKILYWNPDSSQNSAWDLIERNNDPENKTHFRGFHADRYRQVMTRSTYYWNPIDDATTLVNFLREPPKTFKDVPFFVGTAHQGYHVFPGSYGIVTEAHSTRLLTDRQTIEQAEFNPMQNGGAPRGLYRTGMMAVPPGFGF